MKLATLLLGILLAAPSAAAADDLIGDPGGPGAPMLSPPGGPVPADAARDPRAGGRMRDPARAARLRAALVETFDADGDGRLDARERVRAARALQRIERRLVRSAAAERRGAGGRGGAGLHPRKVRRMIERFDANGDGNLGPAEIPPGAARKLRHLDRDGDGWLERGEY